MLPPARRSRTRTSEPSGATTSGASARRSAAGRHGPECTHPGRRPGCRAVALVDRGRVRYASARPEGATVPVDDPRATREPMTPADALDRGRRGLRAASLGGSLRAPVDGRSGRTHRARGPRAPRHRGPHARPGRRPRRPARPGPPGVPAGGRRVAGGPERLLAGDGASRPGRGGTGRWLARPCRTGDRRRQGRSGRAGLPPPRRRCPDPGGGRSGGSAGHLPTASGRSPSASTTRISRRSPDWARGRRSSPLPRPPVASRCWTRRWSRSRPARCRR